MTLTTPQRHNLKALALCALYAFVLLFFLSPDSYLRDLFYRGDSAIFFMCGKAWMNGMTPYVDFADSKGPLLWLIYGIGYLLNHHSYVGVFWISILFYTATLYIAYKLSRLFLDERLAVLPTALLPFCLFFYYVHLEVRAEDFCLPFVLHSLYCLCRIIKEKDLSSKTFFRFALAMGISFMCCLLIKWNIGLMIGSVMLVGFILSFKHKAAVNCILGMLIGAAIIALPFLIYFLCFADFGAMIQEYFVNTILTMDGMTSALDSFSFDRQMLIVEKGTIALLFGLLLFTWRYKRYFWLLLCFILFRVGLGAPHDWYYFAILMPYALFFFIAAVSFAFAKVSQLMHYMSLCYTIAVLLPFVNVWHVNNVYKNASGTRQDYYKAAYIMSQVENPKVFQNTALEQGLGAAIDALPGCRYWTLQKGATDAMLNEREQATNNCQPDFFIVFTYSQSIKSDEYLKYTSLGYILYMASEPFSRNSKLNFALYGRPGLQLPPDDFYVSQWDVWLKRNIFGI